MQRIALKVENIWEEVFVGSPPYPGGFYGVASDIAPRQEQGILPRVRVFGCPPTAGIWIFCHPRGFVLP